MRPSTRRRPDQLGLDSIGLTAADFADPAARPDWLHVVGDVGGAAPLTHWGKYKGGLVGDLIAARADGLPDPVVPTTDARVLEVDRARSLVCSFGRRRIGWRRFQVDLG